ncbi:protein EARLY-RESPONSIVE TO DEHYDRATION 7, chloroplastic-like [Aristolochia californica]|uniref:protein EARLY-RESPONSIVE TO DEHYDRATION 7, chloroplastic-like n=1 Tax=Aristolochia californica TaxID=171875 RepID=UPI0035DB3A39
MASNQSRKNSNSLYPEVIQSNPDSNSPFVSKPSSSSLYPSLDSPPGTERRSGPSPSSSTPLYPSVDMTDLVENLFPEANADEVKNDDGNRPTAPPECYEETLIRIPGAIIHLIDKQYSVELACGDLIIMQLRQGATVLAVLARVANEIQWPLTKDQASVKLDESHYFFSLGLSSTHSGDSSDDEAGSPKVSKEDVLSYGLTFASKGQEKLLKEFDGILENYSSFSVQKVMAKSEALDKSVAKEISPSDLKAGPKKEMLEERSAAYWTTLAPNVEDYNGYVAKGIALGTGQLIKGILWCGDVAVDRLKWGDEVLKKRMDPNAKKADISPETLKRIKRVKKVTKMSEKVASGVLSGVVKVTGFFTSSVVNSKVGKKFFGLLPGELVLASLDGFGRICDAVEVSGKNVLSTSSVVTTGLVSQRYGEQAAELTNESLDAAGHALGTAWAVFKIRKGFNPKSALGPSALAKSAAKAAAAEVKAKQG